jgi:hypothetical protein
MLCTHLPYRSVERQLTPSRSRADVTSHASVGLRLLGGLSHVSPPVMRPHSLTSHDIHTAGHFSLLRRFSEQISGAGRRFLPGAPPVFPGAP